MSWVEAFQRRCSVGLFEWLFQENKQQNLSITGLLFFLCVVFLMTFLVSSPFVSDEKHKESCCLERFVSECGW